MAAQSGLILLIFCLAVTKLVPALAATERELRTVSCGVTLVGTLTTPDSAGPDPAVLILAGSGPPTAMATPGLVA
jgi:hypothetical protein